MQKIWFFVLFVSIFIVGCSLGKTIRTQEFPLGVGTTWVYSYEMYDLSAADPTQIAKATYQLTESVDDVKTVSTYLVAHIKRDFKLINADPDWLGDASGLPKEYWYVMSDHQVFQSNLPLDAANIKVDELILDYDFPLLLNKTWRLTSPRDPKEVTGCEFVGKRVVTNKGSYQTATGNFSDCYDLVDYYNGGNIYQKFCNSVGIVSMKFDHAGTRFGYEQTLIQYSAGVP